MLVPPGKEQEVYIHDEIQIMKIKILLSMPSYLSEAHTHGEGNEGGVVGSLILIPIIVGVQFSLRRENFTCFFTRLYIQRHTHTHKDHDDCAEGKKA